LGYSTLLVRISHDWVVLPSKIVIRVSVAPNNFQTQLFKLAGCNRTLFTRYKRCRYIIYALLTSQYITRTLRRCTCFYTLPAIFVFPLTFHVAAARLPSFCLFYARDVCICSSAHRFVLMHANERTSLLTDGLRPTDFVVIFVLSNRGCCQFLLMCVHRHVVLFLLLFCDPIYLTMIIC
jgi:hypothetical protein